MASRLPQVLVYPYQTKAAKDRHERLTLREFCNAMHRQHGAVLTVASRPLARGLVLNVDGATVDGVLKTPSGFVAVELLSLSPIADRGDVLVADYALRRRVRAAAGRLLTQKCWSLTLWYRERKRPDGTKVKAVPRGPNEAIELAAELKRLLHAPPAVESGRSLYFHFASMSREDASGLQHGNRYYLVADSYPVCYRHLQFVRVDRLPPRVRPSVDSDLKVGFVGADQRFLERKLRDKAERSLGLSLQRANGLPLWLIVHSDGRAIHQSIAPPQRRAALASCRMTLTSLDHGFERAYWADHTGFVNAAWVGRIL